MSESLSARVLIAVREAMKRNHLSQRDMAGFLQCSQSRVAKLLNGRVKLGVDDLESLCFAVSIAPTEAVRDRGLEFVAEMTPTELRLLELIRRLPKPAYDGLLHFMQVNPKLEAEPRGATPRREKYGD